MTGRGPPGIPKELARGAGRASIGERGLRQVEIMPSMQPIASPFRRARFLVPATATVQLAAALASCGPAEFASTYAVRDSAGVRIVESAAPAWAAGEEWTVSDEPAVHIGVVDGPEEYQFTIVTGVFQDGAGRIIVGDAADEVRLYDGGGSYLDAFGRQGEGPGEFRSLISVQPHSADSILAWDGPGRRVSIFDPDGRYARSFLLPMPPRPEQSSGRGILLWTPGGFSYAVGDGTVVSSTGSVFQGEVGELVEGETYLVRHSAEGDTLQTVGPFAVEIDIPDFQAPAQVGRPYPLPLVTTARPGGLYVGNGRSFEVLDISFEGGLERILRASTQDLTLTEEHRETYRASERERLGGNLDPAALESALLEVEYPPTIPPSSQLLVDSEDHLWVRHYSTRWTPGPERWSVFAPDGFLLGTVETPERLQVRQIGPDFLLGIWTDELDIRYIRKYPLRR